MKTTKPLPKVTVKPYKISLNNPEVQFADLKETLFRSRCIQMSAQLAFPFLVWVNTHTDYQYRFGLPRNVPAEILTQFPATFQTFLYANFNLAEILGNPKLIWFLPDLYVPPPGELKMGLIRAWILSARPVDSAIIIGTRPTGG
jgi:hypothetical protein